jgi:hypothetical protein
MNRRLFLASAMAALPLVAHASGGGEDPKKRAGGSSYLVVQTLVGTTTKGAKRGVLTVECGLDVQDANLRERVKQSMPRLRSAFASTVQTYAAGLTPGAPPNADFLARTLQKDTDAVIGRPGAKLLVGTILVN